MLDRLKNELSSLRTSASGVRVRPHKLILVLAVLDLADEDLLIDNQIFFDDDLKRSFQKHFRAFSCGNDTPRAGAPFFHLRSSAFWKHKVRQGFEQEYSEVKKFESSASLQSVQYAYLEDWAFNVISSPDHRAELRQFIVELLTTNNQIMAIAQSDEKLGLSFHRGFPVKRSGLSELLDMAVAGEEMTDKNIKEHTTFGTTQVESFPRYAKRAGLFDEDWQLTSFGEAAIESDLSLSQLSTQWVMHYSMSASHRNAPNFWHHLTLQCLVPDKFLDANEVRAVTADFASECGAKEPSFNTLDTVQTAFLGTYAKPECFGNLEILRSEDNKYRVQRPRPIAAGAFACVLADYWAARWGEKREALLSDLTGGELAALLLLSSGEVNALLGELQSRGLLHRQRRTPPFQVIRQWEDPAALWREQLYP